MSGEDSGMRVIGLDVGGANLKASDGASQSRSQAFALWREPQRLPQALRELLTSLRPWDALAVTMTGELADCFETKADGVDRILRAVEWASEDRPVHVWQAGGEFVTPAEAREIVPLVAAANWHALATWAGRAAPQGAALLLDCGSTTTDIIPLRDGNPVPEGRTDVERLLSGELVYTGIRRTPVCAIASTAPFRGRDCPLAAELFATTLDVYLLLGEIPEAADDLNTPDGRPATRAAAHARLARMLCCDSREFSQDDARNAARFLARQQRNRLASALDRVLARLDRPCGTVMISGAGEFVLRQLVAGVPELQGRDVVSLACALGETHSRAACGFALARLLRERLRPAPASDLLN
jgi:probable H4MPT-linked C1 transfer pathway protein